MKIHKGILAGILFFTFGKNLLAVEYRYEDLAKEEYEYIGSNLGADYDVLNNDEIVYVKNMGYCSLKKNTWGDPEKRKTSVQICRMKINDPDSEKVIFEFEYISFYSKEDYQNHQIYKDQKWKGAGWIKGLDVCQSSGKIAFAMAGDGPSMRNPDPATGLYMMDSEGKGLKRLIPYSLWNPVWNPSGTRIIFNAIGEKRLIPVTGKDKGIFLYDPEKEKCTFITEHNSKAVWTPDGKGIFIEFAIDPEGKGQDITHRINIDGTGLEKTIHPWLVLQSPDGRYWAGVRGVVLEGSIEENRRTVYRPKVDYFRKWFPDSKRLLGVSGENEIIIIDVRDGSVSSAFGNNIDQKGGRA